MGVLTLTRIGMLTQFSREFKMTTERRVETTKSRGVDTAKKWCVDTATIGVYDMMACFYCQSNDKSSNDCM